jgi:transposase
MRLVPEARTEDPGLSLHQALSGIGQRVGVNPGHVGHHVSERPVEHGGRGAKYLTGMVDLTPRRDGTRPLGCSISSPAAPGRPAPTGSPPAARSSETRCARRRWTRSKATRTRSTTSSPTRPRSWMRSSRQARHRRGRRVPPPSPAGHSRPPRPQERPALPDPQPLCAGQERLTERQQSRLQQAFDANERHVEVELAWRCAQQLRSVYHRPAQQPGTRPRSRSSTPPPYPVPEIARLGRTLRQSRREFLGYFDTGGASNGGTEAVNGLIELHRRIARAFRTPTTTDYASSSTGGGLTHPHLR